MRKERFLDDVKRAAAGHVASKDEVSRAYDEGLQTPVAELEKHHIGISTILYDIGGGIVFLGLVNLIGQQWDALNAGMRIFVTLGAAIAFFISAVFLEQVKGVRQVATALHLVAVLLMPAGLFVTFHELGVDVEMGGYQSIIFAILTVVYFATYMLYKRNLLLLFDIIFATILFFTFTNYLVGTNPIFDELNFFEYRALAVGVAYIALGYAFVRSSRAVLTGVLYAVGILGILGSTMALGGFKPNQNLFWELAYPGIVFGVIFSSLYLRSRAFLAFGVLFLGGYIFKITAEYFADSIGWPVALIFLGFVLMGVGYLTFYLHKKYISSTQEGGN